MACEKCKDISESFPENPFRVRGRPCSDRLRSCDVCGAKYFQFNPVCHLWREIPEETFLTLQKDTKAILDGDSGMVINSHGFDFG